MKRSRISWSSEDVEADRTLQRYPKSIGESREYAGPDSGMNMAAEALDAVEQLTALLHAKSHEAEQLRAHLESIEQIAECCICLDRPVSHAFSPCGHLFCCARSCQSANFLVCPLCRTPVQTKTRLYGVVDALEKKRNKAALIKVRSCIESLEDRLKTKEREQHSKQGQACISELKESEISTQASIVALESSLGNLETLLGAVERELALKQISEAFKSADARSIANVMQQWNFSLQVQQAGCRALKSLEAAPRVRASSKASWALSTLRVCAAVTQALRAFKQCTIVQEHGMIALANFTIKGSRLQVVDAAACVSDCLHAMSVCAKSRRVCTAACILLCSIVESDGGSLRAHASRAHVPQLVLAVLTTHARTHAPALAERACQLLALMVWNEESQTRLGALGALGSLAALLGQHLKDLGVMRRATCLLWRLCHLHHANCAAVADTHCRLPAEGLTPHPLESTEVWARWKGGSFYAGKIKAVNADKSFAVEYDDGDFDSTVPAAHVKLAAGALGTTPQRCWDRVLVAAAAEKAAAEKAAETGAGAGAPGARCVVAGVHEAVVLAMALHIRDEELVTHGCLAVWAVCWNNEGAAERLAAAGAVSVILSAMRMHGEQPASSQELYDAAAAALWSLALCEKGLADMLRSQEAYETVVLATSLHPSAARCQRFGRLLIQLLRA